MIEFSRKLKEIMGSRFVTSNKIGYGHNTEGHLCVWDGGTIMHYFDEDPYLNQAKIMVLLLRIAKKLKVDVKL
jgi:hypothetical protein